ncbi:ATP-binding protein [Streptomyces sp. NPDC057927]
MGSTASRPTWRYHLRVSRQSGRIRLHVPAGGTKMRIKSVRIEGFRGISRPTTLNFSNSAAGSPSSCLLMGENGAGKSTFVAALEFCLTARYPAFSVQSRQDFLRSLSNLASTPGSTRVEVEFSDGKKYARSLEFRDGSWEMDPATPHLAFRSGLALHREEIINFLRTHPKGRHAVFASFMRGASALAGVPGEDLEAVEKAEGERDRLVGERDRLARPLAKAAKSSFRHLSSNLHDVQSFNAWLTSKGYSKRQDERRLNYLPASLKGIYKQAADVRDAIHKVRRATDQVNRLKKSAVNAPLFALLSEVGETLTDSFKRISPSAESVRSVKLSLESDRSEIDLHVTLSNDAEVRAEEYFSEANLDLLALLLFLSLMKYAGQNGQPKIMALDDVLQSVDASIRVKVAQYLLAEFHKWQFLVTFHDRLWREQFAAVFSSKHQFVEREIFDWDLMDGPRLVELRRDASDALRECLDSSDTRIMCGNAGFLLEVLSDWLSKSLQTSITRRHGDKYTLGDTWSGVASKLGSTALKEKANNVDRYMWLRNMHGAHYNEWATDLSIVDAKRFASAVLELWDSVWCGKCRECAGRHGDLIHCRCGTVSIEKA